MKQKLENVKNNAVSALAVFGAVALVGVVIGVVRKIRGTKKKQGADDVEPTAAKPLFEHASRSGKNVRSEHDEFGNLCGETAFKQAVESECCEQAECCARC